MSLILEALRKSEAERQRAQGPGLHAPASIRRVERDVPGWGPWAAAAVGAALLFGTWWVNRPVPPPTPESRVERVAEGGVPGPERPALENPAPPQGIALEPDSPPPKPVEQPRRAPAPLASEPAREPTPPPPASPPSVTEPVPPPSEFLPTLSSLAADERASLPPLKVSMFVYSPEPGRRFAIVDGQRVGEGGLLAGGTVAEIRPDGVVIDLGGRRLLLPRP
jgi:general secretion pathway protein B